MDARDASYTAARVSRAWYPESGIKVLEPFTAERASSIPASASDTSNVSRWRFFVTSDVLPPRMAAVPMSMRMAKVTNRTATRAIPRSLWIGIRFLRQGMVTGADTVVSDRLGVQSCAASWYAYVTPDVTAASTYR